MPTIATSISTNRILPTIRSGPLGLVLIVTLVAAAGGCTSSTTESDPLIQTSSNIELPQVVESPDQIRQAMKQHEPFSPQFEKERLKLLIAWDKIRQQAGVEGFETSPLQSSKEVQAFVHPVTKQIAWRALACFNPECKGQGKGGGPLLFVRPFDCITVGPDGKLIFGTPDPSELNKPCVCPACKSGDFIRPYDPPETEAARQKLGDEMRQVMKTYASGKSATHSNPNLRTPQQIMTEIANLPKLFLFPDTKKTVQEGVLQVPSNGSSQQ